MKRLLIAAGFVITLLLTGCAPSPRAAPGADQPTGAPAATGVTNTAACTAIQLAANGEWQQSETHWLTAELADSSTAFEAYQMVTDTEAVALDQIQHGSNTANDISVYNSDLANAGDLTAGC